MGSAQSQPEEPMRLREALAKFSDALVPSEEYYKNGNVAANEIFNLLQKNRKDVDRVIIGGSMGKRTAISTMNLPGAGSSKPPDFDVVVFLNKKEPPFQQVLSEFNDVFVKANIKITYKGDYLVVIEYKGYSMDVSPAPNFRNGSDRDTQRAKVLTAIATSEDKPMAVRAYGPGLVEFSLEFMKSQTAAAHKLARLAKFWNSKIKMGQYVPGRSYLIECVAIYAYRQTTNKSILEMFIKFLEAMKDFRNLHINLNQAKLPLFLQTKTPVILEPVNQFNNLAKLSRPIIDKFIQAAGHSLSKLTVFQAKNGNTAVIASMLDLIQLIDPSV